MFVVASLLRQRGKKVIDIKMNNIQFPSSLEEALRASDSSTTSSHDEGGPTNFYAGDVKDRGTPDVVLFNPDPQLVLTARILEAFDNSITAANRVDDPGLRDFLLGKLMSSFVRGSRVEGVNSHEAAKALLKAVKGWKQVICNKGPNLQVFQGSIPQSSNYRAYAAYATIRQIYQTFGAAGTDAISVKKGRQRPDEFYFYMLTQMPTDLITVQLKTEPDGMQIELLQQWFSGPEASSIQTVDPGDTIVRCGVRLPHGQPNTSNQYNTQRPFRRHEVPNPDHSA